MAKVYRKRFIKIALETDKGTKVAGTQALYTEDLEMKPTAEFVQRRGSGNSTGNGQPGTLNEPLGEFNFKTEMRGSGAGAIEPGILLLLQSGGLKNAAGYKPCSVPADQKCLSIDGWEDGKKKGLYGAMGKLKIEGETGKKVWLTCNYLGKWVPPTDEAMPAYAPSTSKPLKMAGGTFTVAGTAKKISKFTLDFGSDVQLQPDPNASGGVSNYIITDHDATVSFDPEVESVAVDDVEGKWVAGTEVAVILVLTDGTDTITITIPKAQYKEVPTADRNGIAVHEVTCQCNNTNGDDAFSIA
jgi:hypothetical protein